eukprot:Phypoly_transcript_00168.p1 GENE.Phypoly_transcript_00168~~Phypoly_transcript_00168.p1  ORF type:complete len:1453 (+),score=233.55 Phypoly_transcript_00168:484-4359(+)
MKFGLAVILVMVGLFVKEGVEEEERQKLIEKQRAFGTLSLLEVEGTRNPYEGANFFSKLFVHWPASIVAVGFRRPLESSDLWHLPKDDTAEMCVAKLEQNWYTQLTKPTPSLAKALWAVHGHMLIACGFVRLINDVATLGAPIILYFILLYVEKSDPPLWEGFVLVAAMFVCFLIQSVAINISQFLCIRVSNQVRAAIAGLVFRKAVRISSVAKEKFSAGEILNFQSVDANRVAFVIPFLNYVWTSPFQIIVIFVLLWQFIGVALFGGLGVLLLVIPLSVAAAGKMGGYQQILVLYRDRRIRLVNEMLSGIRLVKFFNWENFFEQRAHEMREEEIAHQKKTAYAQALVIFILFDAPLFVSVASFVLYFLMGNTLTATIIFTALSLISSLRVPLGLIPLTIGGIVESRLSIARLEEFLLAEDIDTTAIEKVPLPDREVLQFVHASFKWTKNSESDTLRNLHFSVKQGELVAVVGAVGSGKSSLLAAILGELHKSSGRVCVNGSVAYVPQQAWMQNATLRGNILFGKQHIDAKYRHCVECCELMQDIRILPNGDMTEIGEKGINLSGGQKQRISLARAMYQDASIYLLDSPLSAVDAHVGRAIFENLILGALSNTARIFVTHQLDLLHRADKIIVMNEGAIAEMGTYEELMASGRYFSELVTKYVQQQQEEEGEEGSVVAELETIQKAPAKKKKAPTQDGGVPGERTDEKGKLIEKEEKKEGTISPTVYKAYIKAAGYGIVIFSLLVHALEAASYLSVDGWLAFWADRESRDTKFLFIYIGLAGSTLIFTIIRAYSFIYATIRAARTLHHTLLLKILHVPMYFFDTTPIGRVINRFSRDVVSIDSYLPTALEAAVPTTFTVLTIVAVVSTATPVLLVPLLPIVYVIYYLHQYFMTSSREVQRLESVSRSPIYSLFSETLNGISTIRSFEMLPAFIFDNDYKIDRNMKALFAINGVGRWFAVRLELLVGLVVTLVTFFCVIVAQGTIPAGVVGLAVGYAMQLGGCLNYLVRQFVDVENYVISVERVVEYSELPQEAANMPVVSTPKNWPSRGEIAIQDLVIRYREGLTPVLKAVTAKIKSSEKIGIVGRTGAGKSSLFLALFRLVEPTNGAIYIDDVNIAKVKLSTLRSRLAIIPQDPVLFTGTIRSNLDPFNEYPDAELWDAINTVHLRGAIEKLPNRLDSDVVENGENFSVGERQLLCLGRALLRKAKILLMDEATASVDVETDDLIQRTIREKCKDVTVLTIAHRINTILDSDRVMVLDKGHIVEFDTPTVLANDPATIFYSLLQESKKNV